MICFSSSACLSFYSFSLPFSVLFPGHIIRNGKDVKVLSLFPGLEIQFRAIDFCQSLPIHLSPRACASVFINQNVIDICSEPNLIINNSGLKISCHASVLRTPHRSLLTLFLAAHSSHLAYPRSLPPSRLPSISRSSL